MKLICIYLEEGHTDTKEINSITEKITILTARLLELKSAL